MGTLHKVNFRVPRQQRDFAEMLKRDFAHANITLGNAIGGLALATRECADRPDQQPNFAEELREIAALLDAAYAAARARGW